MRPTTFGAAARPLCRSTIYSNQWWRQRFRMSSLSAGSPMSPLFRGRRGNCLRGLGFLPMSLRTGLSSLPSSSMRVLPNSLTHQSDHHHWRQFSSSPPPTLEADLSHIRDKLKQIMKKSWNVRVEEFLRATATHTLPADVVDEDDSGTDADRGGGVLVLQELLDQMLEITEKAAMKRKGFLGPQGGQVPPDDVEHTLMEDEQCTNWSLLNPFGMGEVSSAGRSNAHNSNLLKGDEGEVSESIQSSLAFALLDRLVELEKSSRAGEETSMLSALTDHTLQWSVHTDCLNPVLVLWRDECARRKNDIQNSVGNVTRPHLLTPKDVISKLDRYRQASNLLLPDTMSYNIILDAIAKTTTSSTSSPSLEDDDFGTHLWHWMIEESKHDPLIRPDKITLRTLFKTFVASGNPDAPQRCEKLVEEWMAWQETNASDVNSHSDPTLLHGSILESLVHCWALYDPTQAERYLHDLTERFFSSIGDNVSSGYSTPPATVTWNRVISAYAIEHDDPHQAHQVLENFWDFYQQAHNGSDADPNNNNDVRSGPHPNAWKVGRPDLWSYNAVLEGYARQENAEEANRVFGRLMQVDSTAPNIQSYTSVMKANGDDLNTVHSLAKQCLDTYRQQEKNPTTNSNGVIVDRPFFHAWLYACAKARNVDAAKEVMMNHLKSVPHVQPNTATYLAFLEVFLSIGNSQGAIEWLLAYAKLEKMSEDAIVAWTTRLLEWYDDKATADGVSKETVDSTVLMQILIENGFVADANSLERLLLGGSPDQAKQTLGWIRKSARGDGKNRPTMKMYVITLRALAQDGDRAREIEELFHQWQRDWGSSPWEKGQGEVERSLLADMYASLIVVWSKRNNLKRMQYWIGQLTDEFDGALPPLNRAAQIAIVNAFCRTNKMSKAEEFVLSMKKAHEEGRADAVPPDTPLYNMVLRGWVQQSNGGQAVSFFERLIPQPDKISYNSVINALCKEGNLEQAEEWAARLVDTYRSNHSESLRPDASTFTVILAGWRRAGHQRGAAKRAQRILRVMEDLHKHGILSCRPDAQSYQVVLDTWQKSSHRDAAQLAQELLLSAPRDIQQLEKLRMKVRSIWKSRQRIEGKQDGRDTSCHDDLKAPLLKQKT